ncbi:hypothetical protein [Jeotgalibacillus marinus]|uniref:Uncharacterized protein n=1 Tax=Jeotgalibacillus marinus TaxID=86667 RepID=A0ABV3Q122_9BACL
MKKIILVLFLLANLFFIGNLLISSDPMLHFWGVLFIIGIIVPGVLLSKGEYLTLSLVVLFTNLGSFGLFLFLYFLTNLIG